MLTKIGEKFTDIFQKNMPDAFVFALVLTILTAISAFFVADAAYRLLGADSLKVIRKIIVDACARRLQPFS